MILNNVVDRRHGIIGSFEVRPLKYDLLTKDDIGSTVIYRDQGERSEAGTLVSWSNGFVFAQYSKGDTAAGALPENLFTVIRSLP